MSPGSGLPVSGLTVVPGVGVSLGSTAVSVGYSMREMFWGLAQLPGSPLRSERAMKKL